MNDFIKIGRVSAINEATGAVEVVFQDKDDIVTDELPLLAFEYYMPEINDLVLCVFLGNGIEAGFCLGRYFSDVYGTPVQDKAIYYKDFFGEASVKYDKNTKTLFLDAENIVINGINFDQHIHSGVEPGGANTGGPQ